ncbi:hypothetical protein Ndes2526B_g03232 [Nannochloris sp. 'desiccata']|nr:hypothetical protein KSW81_006541 [Chlorella desiccata (nom. nud.)]
MNHLDDLAKVLRGILLVASRAAENRSLTRNLKQKSNQILEAVRQAAPAATTTITKATTAAKPIQFATSSAAQPLTQPSFTTSAASTLVSEQFNEQPMSSKHEGNPRIEPEIHGLQGVTVFREESSSQVASSSPNAISSPTADSTPQSQGQKRKFAPRERAVPSNSFSRALGFAGLGASLIFGTAKDSVTRAWRGGGSSSSSSSNSSGTTISDSGNTTANAAVYSSFLSESNAERLAEALCRMRGAALKLGQMLSIQDENVLPPQFQAALERVRAGADVMPRRQLEKVLNSELGSDWREQVQTFDEQPLAAASIGQVHGATMHDGRRVVMKVQYPGVAKSIESDVDNLMRLISVANLLPRGLYVENAVAVAKKELALECDYHYEAAAQARFAELVASDSYCAQNFRVPAVVPELSSQRVLASEWAPGIHIDKVAELSQKIRDSVGTRLLALTLKELYEWNYMQTDPNWGNFLYDPPTDLIHLIDFGAAKEYSPQFVAEYLEMVKGCAEKDSKAIVDRSTALGFLTGDESKVMLDAHVEAAIAVGTPFAFDGNYDFGAHGALTKRVTELGAVMLKHRLTPPPDESYSLHRKLSGAFLACIKLRARVPCRELFYVAYRKHHERSSRLGNGVDTTKAATG